MKYENTGSMFGRQNQRLLTEENTRLREALKFYADEETYELTGEKNYIGHGDYEESTWFEIDRDKGDIARTALEGESR